MPQISFNDEKVMSSFQDPSFCSRLSVAGPHIFLTVSDVFKAFRSSDPASNKYFVLLSIFQVLILVPVDAQIYLTKQIFSEKMRKSVYTYSESVLMQGTRYS